MSNYISCTLSYDSDIEKFTFTCTLTNPKLFKLQSEVTALLSFLYDKNYPIIKGDIFNLSPITIDNLDNKISKFREIGIIISANIQHHEFIHFIKNKMLANILFYSPDKSDILKYTIEYLLGSEWKNKIDFYNFEIKISEQKNVIASLERKLAKANKKLDKMIKHQKLRQI